MASATAAWGGRTTRWPRPNKPSSSTWAPLTYTDEDPPQQDNTVAHARRSAAADAARRHDQDGRTYRSFRGLLEHLATLTRNRVRFGGTGTEIPVLAEPTSAQRQAFDLIGAAIPLALK